MLQKFGAAIVKVKAILQHKITFILFKNCHFYHLEQPFFNLIPSLHADISLQIFTHMVHLNPHHVLYIIVLVSGRYTKVCGD